MSLVDSMGGSMGSDPDQTVIRVFLVNGESRSFRFDERTDVSVSHKSRFVDHCYKLNDSLKREREDNV